MRAALWRFGLKIMGETGMLPSMDFHEGLFLDHALPADFPAIMELERAGFDSAIVEAESVFRERLEVFPQGFLVLRASGRGEVLGYYCSELWQAVPAKADYSRAFCLGHAARERFDPSGSVLYTASLTIHPSLRGTGAGKSLFRSARKQIMESVPKIREELLVVNTRWARARSMYLSEGFAETGTMKAFFPSSEGSCSDAIVMRRRFRRSFPPVKGE